MFTRRHIIKGMMLAGGFYLLPMGTHGWALAAPQQANRRLIVILMRGAVDGLNIVTPYMDRNYYAARSTIALPPPNQGGLVDLDGFFGLNPALNSVMPLWQNRSLAFIHASGSPAPTRSHFEAQDILETAMLNSAMAQQGWMNGLAQILPNNHSPTRTLSYGDRLPKIFQGKYNVSTLPTHMHAAAAQDPRMTSAFAQMYGNQSELGGLYQQGVSAQASMSKDMQEEMQSSGQGAPGTDAFVAQTTQAAAMIRRDPSIQLMFMDVGGWDTHVGQGGVKGQLANKLEKFGEGLAALANGLGSEYQNTTILVMSEFGRTVAENGNGGTDHGHGNVAWVMGGTVQGGKVWGRWPGLDRNHLNEGRDLAVTTDFRSIIGAVLQGQFGMGDEYIAAIIPNYAPDAGLRDIVV